MKRIITLLILVSLMSANTASAAFFDNWFKKPNPITPQSQQDRWTSLQNNLTALNTPANVAKLQSVMTDYGYQNEVIAVQLKDLKQVFFIDYNNGVTFKTTAPTMIASLTEGQVRNTIRLINENPEANLTWWTKIKIYRELFPKL